MAQAAAGQWDQARDDRNSITNWAPAPWPPVTHAGLGWAGLGWAGLGWAGLSGTKGFLSCFYSPRCSSPHVNDLHLWLVESGTKERSKGQTKGWATWL